VPISMTQNGIEHVFIRQPGTKAHKAPMPISMTQNGIEHAFIQQPGTKA